MATDEVDRGCEQAGAGAGSFHADLLVLTVQEVIRTVTDKLGQGVAWIQRQTENRVSTATLTGRSAICSLRFPFCDNSFHAARGIDQ